MVPQNIKNRILGSSSEAGYSPSMHEVQSPALHTKELKIELKKEKKGKSNKTPALLIRTYAEELKAGAQRDNLRIHAHCQLYMQQPRGGDSHIVLSRRVHQ